MDIRRNDTGFWQKQLEKICSALGLSLERETVNVRGEYGAPDIEDRLVLKRGRSYATYKVRGSRAYGSGREVWDAVQEPVGPEPDDVEKSAELLFRRLSGLEIVVRGTEEETRPSPFGYTKIRTEQHILMPEFSSAEEFKIKFAAEGEW